MASAVVALLTPHASNGGFTAFEDYFRVGDWLTLRLPLIGAACATVAALVVGRDLRSPTSRTSGIVRVLASLLRGLSVASGITCGSLTVGTVLWMVVLRVEATDRYFSHYADWPVASLGYTLVQGASIGFGSVAFAFMRDDAWRAGYFTLCSGLLTLSYALGAVSYDVVGATYGWPALAALMAAGLTVVGAPRRLRVVVAIGAGLLVAAMLFALAFARWTTVVAVLWLLTLQALTLRWLLAHAESADAVG